MGTASDGLEERVFDVIVIGAGINGAGIARDAAIRGYSVLLIDKGDIASGTTSWPTRLIHGGLRYLEHGEIGLVRESLRERERLLYIAPHLVRPLPLLIPIYRWDKRGPLVIRIGMLAYDLLSLDKSLPGHRMLGSREALRRVPGLNPEGLRAAAMYYDCQAEYPERLTLENALSAAHHGAVVRTYTRARSLLREDRRVVGVELQDELSGEVSRARGRVVLNVAGPWVDDVLAEYEPPLRRLVGGTKGSHVVVPPFPGAPAEALYVEARQDHRPFFIVPWNRHYLVGTTDLRYEGDLDRVEASEEEIAYLLRETANVIPGCGLTRSSVLYTYSGVRPLPYQEDGAEGSITRRHILHDHAPALEGLISIIGGKLTTYRSLAEQAVDEVGRKLGRRGRRGATGGTLLPGATGDFDAFRDRFIGTSGLPERTSDHLVRVYGVRAREVLRLAKDCPELARPFDEETGAIGAEIVFAFEQEMARTLADAMLRRTMVGLNSSAGLDSLEAAAGIARKHLGWDEERARREVEDYLRYVERLHPRSLGAREATAPLR